MGKKKIKIKSIIYFKKENKNELKKIIQKI